MLYSHGDCHTVLLQVCPVVTSFTSKWGWGGQVGGCVVALWQTRCSRQWPWSRIKIIVINTIESLGKRGRMYIFEMFCEVINWLTGSKHKKVKFHGWGWKKELTLQRDLRRGQINPKLRIPFHAGHFSSVTAARFFNLVRPPIIIIETGQSAECIHLCIHVYTRVYTCYTCI